MDHMLRLRITQEVLDNNPWMDVNSLGGFIWVPCTIDAVANTADNTVAKAAADEPATGDGYVGTRPPDGRP